MADLFNTLDKYDYGQFLLEVGKGNVPGHRAVSINGVNDFLEPGDGQRMIWRVDADYNFQTTAAALFAVSSNNADTQTLAITYLDDNFDEVSVEVALTGQTPVQFSTGTGIRVNACSTRGTTSFLGNVSLMVGSSVTAGVPNSTNDIVGNVPASTQRLNQALFTVPNGKEGIVLSCTISVGKDQDALFKTHILHPTDHPNLTITELQAFQSTSQINFTPFTLQPKTDAFIEAGTTLGSTTVSLRCLFLLIDQDLVNTV